MRRRFRNSLLVSWVAVSVVLCVARHWQHHALYTGVQRHSSATLLPKDIWSVDSAHTTASATNVDAAAAVVEPQFVKATTAHAGPEAPLGSRSYHASGASVQLVLHTDTSTIGSSSLSSRFGVDGGWGEGGVNGVEEVHLRPQHSRVRASIRKTVPHIANPNKVATNTSSEGAGSSVRASAAAVNSPSVDAGASKGTSTSQHAANSDSSTEKRQQPQQQFADAGRSSSIVVAAGDRISNTSSIGGSSSSKSSSSSNQTAISAAESVVVINPSDPGSSSSSSSTGPAAYAQELLRPVLDASARAKSDPVYLQKLRDAARLPINIAVMTGLFWQLPTDHLKGCEVDGVPLTCHIQNGGNEDFLNKADALYYHVPSFAGRPRAKAFATQLRLAMSLESSAYYSSLDNPAYMCHFDAEMTYRTCGQVTNWYSLESLHKLFQTKPVPFEEKLHAIAYINSNCGAQSGRSDIMRALIDLGDKLKVPVHAMGSCGRNTPWPSGNPHKIDVMRRYKFCVAMENSIRQDYMTEKMWDALAAGCIPVYLGSSNAQHIVPDPTSFIVYDASGKSGHASTPEQLDAVMHEIGSNKTRYEAMLAWKQRKPEDQSNEIFRYLWSVRQTTGECFLCQFLARHRAEPQSEYTTCLFNKDWLASAGQSFTPKEQACPADKTKKADRI